MDYDTILIAIDTGKDSTKYVYKNEGTLQRGVFRTKVQKIENCGVETEKNTFLVNFNNQQYLIGDMVSESKVSFDLSKKSIEHKLCIYIAIAKALENRGNHKIKIAIGAPLSIYKNASLKEDYKNYIMDKGNIDIGINGQNIKFELVDVLILPESIGPIYSNLNSNSNANSNQLRGRVSVIDIGGLNTNICRFNNLVPDISSMIVCNKGANILKSKIADALSEKYGIILYSEDVEQILQDNNILYLKGKPQADSKDLIKELMKEHLNDIVNFAKKNELDIFNSNGKVVFSGGGSMLLKEIIQEIFSYSQIATEAQFSNVLAFYKVLSIKNGQA